MLLLRGLNACYIRQPVLAQEVVRLLTQLMVLRGFESNPDLPGCEKLAVTPVQKQWLSATPMVLTSESIGVDPHLLPPQQAFMVKGWNRAVCCHIVALASFQSEEFRKAGGS